MRVRAVVGVALGATGVLAIGVWLGGQRAAAHVPPTTPAPVHATAPTLPASLSPRARAAARASTPQLPAKPMVPGLAEDLRDPDPRVRRTAIDETDDARVLADASRDASLDVAVAATEGLARLYRDGAIDARELVARAGDAPAKVRVAAINGLGLVPSPDSAAALAQLLATGGEIERRSAAIVLVHQDPHLAVPALIGALRDADDNVRMNAREALRTIARGRDLGDDAGAWLQWWQARAR
jgi:HEAT repeat protein